MLIIKISMVFDDISPKMFWRV